MIKLLEDIDPLTVVSMRHGKFAVIEGYCNYSCVQSLQENEECQYDPDKFMKENWAHIHYGIGPTVAIALQNFK